MRRDRRTFLKLAAAGLGTAAAGSSLWAAFSDSRGARWLRRIAADSRREVRPAPARPEVKKWSENRITVAWLGHATVLVNFYGLWILTDPALENRVGVSLGLGTAGPKRFVAPALEVRDLPPIDLVLLSHAHMDHMDLPTLGKLKRSVPIITARLTADIIDGKTPAATELAWGETHRVSFQGRGDLKIEAFEVKHWGKRWPSELERGYCGYILRREGKALLFGGDTADTPHFAELKSKGPFEIALMPIGAYQPWIWNHCTPEQAVQMARAAGAKYIVPVHHQTFQLSHEPMNEPIERFQEALADEPERIALRSVGETFVAPKFG